MRDLTLTEARDALRKNGVDVSIDDLLRLAESGKIPAKKEGGSIFTISAADLDPSGV
jgi:hypothetical protein